MTIRSGPIRGAALGVLVALGVPLGCATTVDGALSPTDGAVTGDGGASADACVEWVLTDEEQLWRGEPVTDEHRTFDAAGRLLRREGHIRTGGHGIDRTPFEHRYEWSPGRLVVTQRAVLESRVTYTLDGANLVERATESSEPSLRASVRFVRDAAGRLSERIETRASPMTENRCRYTYDAAGHLLQTECTEGALDRFRWEGDRPVRRDHSWRGRYPGFDVWRWSPSGLMLSEQHDDGYGPGRGYRYDHTWDAQGRLLRSEQSSDTSPTPRLAAVYTWDARGRLEREERGFDEAGIARSVMRWERDAEGRVSRSFNAEGAVTATYAYAVTPTQIEVTVTSGESRSFQRYRCLSTPVHYAPTEPQPMSPLPSTNPQVEPYPQTRPLP
jgi:hypothetical protein